MDFFMRYVLGAIGVVCLFYVIVWPSIKKIVKGDDESAK
jgi:hypothetical protein